MTAMPKYILKMSYSSASWARMLQLADDRVEAVTTLVEHLGGKLDAMYWEVENASSYAITDLPDSVSAAAAMTTATKTGAFKDVYVHEVLTSDQLREMLALARSSDGIYRTPGTSNVERDDI